MSINDDKQLDDNDERFTDSFSEWTGGVTLSPGTTISSLPSRYNHEPTSYILPSFYMHQSILNRNAFLNHTTYPGFLPPSYCDENNSNLPDGHLTEMIYCSTANGSILNNIDRMKKIPTSQLAVEMFVTEGPCLKGQKPPREINLLKEFDTGEYVYGYYTIKASTNKPVKFEQMTVSLEGTVTCYDEQSQKSTTKKFLRMIDLGGCYTLIDVPVDNAGTPVCTGEVDKYDGTVLCFGGNQLVRSDTVYKKFFRFKFPDQLLDEVCEYYQNSHLALPPTIGADPLIRKKAQVDPYLGYGRVKSSLLLNDFSPPSISVNYSLKVRIVSEYLQKGEEIRYGILGNCDYPIRFVPSPPILPHNFEMSTFKQIKMELKDLESDYEDVKRRAELGLTLSDPLQRDLSDEDSFNRKLQQLSISTGAQSQYPGKAKHVYSNTMLLIESSKLINVFKNSKNDDKKLGEMVMNVDSPIDLFDYNLPNLIRKYNQLTQSSKKVKSVKLHLKFNPKESSIKPPNFKDLKVKLVINTVFSKYSIPVFIDDEFMLNEENVVNLKKELLKIADKFKQLPPKTKMQATTFDKLNLLTQLSIKSIAISAFKVSNIVSTNWKPMQELQHALSWTKTVEFDLELDEAQCAHLTLLPNFQSCLLSRFYKAEISMSFAGYGQMSVTVPVSVEKANSQLLSHDSVY